MSSLQDTRKLNPTFTTPNRNIYKFYVWAAFRKIVDQVRNNGRDVHSLHHPPKARSRHIKQRGGLGESVRSSPQLSFVFGSSKMFGDFFWHLTWRTQNITRTLHWKVKTNKTGLSCLVKFPISPKLEQVNYIIGYWNDEAVFLLCFQDGVIGN